MIPEVDLSVKDVLGLADISRIERNKPIYGNPIRYFNREIGLRVAAIGERLTELKGYFNSTGKSMDISSSVPKGKYYVVVDSNKAKVVISLSNISQASINYEGKISLYSTGANEHPATLFVKAFTSDIVYKEIIELIKDLVSEQRSSRREKKSLRDREKYCNRLYSLI